MAHLQLRAEEHINAESARQGLRARPEWHKCARTQEHRNRNIRRRLLAKMQTRCQYLLAVFLPSAKHAQPI